MGPMKTEVVWSLRDPLVIRSKLCPLSFPRNENNLALIARALTNKPIESHLYHIDPRKPLIRLLYIIKWIKMQMIMIMINLSEMKFILPIVLCQSLTFIMKNEKVSTIAKAHLTSMLTTMSLQ